MNEEISVSQKIEIERQVSALYLCKNFSEVIQEFERSLNFSRKELSEKSGIATTTLSKLVNNHMKTTIKNIEKISKVFDIDMEFLLLFAKDINTLDEKFSKEYYNFITEFITIYKINQN